MPNKKNNNMYPQAWEDIQKAKISKLPKKVEFTSQITNYKSGVLSKAVILLEKIKLD
jgi:hypothetical protein